MNLDMNREDDYNPYTDIINGKWNKDYFLYQQLPFFFKLKDCKNIIQKIQSKLKSDENFKQLFLLQQVKLDELKTIKIWLKNETGILKITLFDVYLSLIRFFKDESFEEQLFGLHSVSLMGPLGPFKEIPLISCLNEELVSHFIFKHILKNKLPNRGIRVRTNGEVKVLFGKDFLFSSLLKVRQITDAGILFSSSDESFLRDKDDNQLTKIFFDSSVLSYVIDNNLEKDIGKNPFYTNCALNYFLIEEKKIHKSISYNSCHSNEIYFFCRYSYMKESELPNVCQLFLQHAKQKMISYF